MIHKTGIDVWYTEGFNPHPYVNFAVPLSLGFQSEYEVMDIRVTDDSLKNEEIAEKLSNVFPNDIELISVSDPVDKTGKIAYAEYRITFESNEEINKKVVHFLSFGDMTVTKTSKRGKEITIDASEKIRKIATDFPSGQAVINLILPVGNETINPTLIINKLFSEEKTGNIPVSITRTMLYKEDLTVFR